MLFRSIFTSWTKLTLSMLLLRKTPSLIKTHIGYSPKTEALTDPVRHQHKVLDFSTLGFACLRIIIILYFLLFSLPDFFFRLNFAPSVTFHQRRDLPLEAKFS